MQVTDQPIQSDVDLCGVKGSYYISLSEEYPLRYELALVYQQDSEIGEAVEDIFLTQEAQYLISEVGLAPTFLGKSYGVLYGDKMTRMNDIELLEQWASYPFRKSG